MKYFACFLSMKDEEKSQKYRPQHLDFLETMRQEKKVLMNGRFTDGAGGLVIYRAKSLDEAKELAEQDPYIQLGAREYDIHEWELVTDYNFD